MLDIFDESFFNSTAGVTCNPGFDPNTTTIACLETGKWEGAQCISKCKIICLFTFYLNIFMCQKPIVILLQVYETSFGKSISVCI